MTQRYRSIYNWAIEYLQRSRLPNLQKYGSLDVLGSRADYKRPNHLLIFADSMGPTLQINFLRPLANPYLSKKFVTWVVTEKAMARALKVSGEEKFLSFLRAMFSDFRPTAVIASRFGEHGANSILDLSRQYNAPLIAHMDDNLFLVNTDKEIDQGSNHETARLIRAVLV